MKELLFIILSLLIIISAIMVIASKNPIHSIFFLVLVFVGNTGLLLILNVEFIAMLFLVVYVGAILVLFLFVIMMLNVRIVELRERFVRYLPIGGFIGFVFFIEILFVINENLLPDYVTILEMINLKSTFSNEINNSLNWDLELLVYNNFFEILNLTNIQQISLLLYTKYVYLFILSGLILLVAMIGAIALTLNQKFKHKYQDIYKQTNKKLNESIKYLR